MMKRVLIASAIAVGLLSAAGAPANEDEHHVKKEDLQYQRPRDGPRKAGRSWKVTRTIEVEMNDAMRFKPDNIQVRRGETIRFLVRNTGKVKHEMVLGTIKELKEHAGMMRKFPGMAHADPNQVSVDPGMTGELVWQFTKAGRSISPAWCPAISKRAWSARFGSATDA